MKYTLIEFDNGNFELGLDAESVEEAAQLMRLSRVKVIADVSTHFPGKVVSSSIRLERNTKKFNSLSNQGKA